MVNGWVAEGAWVHASKEFTDDTIGILGRALVPGEDVHRCCEISHHKIRSDKPDKSVGAVRAHHRGFPYDVTKGAINAMTRAMAIDLGSYGIRVNAVGPGVTHTYRTDAATDAETYRATADRIPLRRYGTVADIASVVAFLASSQAAYVTGQVIYVDGGITAQLSPSGTAALERDDAVE